jgi:hypothetical protein
MRLLDALFRAADVEKLENPPLKSNENRSFQRETMGFCSFAHLCQFTLG